MDIGGGGNRVGRRRGETDKVKPGHLWGAHRGNTNAYCGRTAHWHVDGADSAEGTTAACAETKLTPGAPMGPKGKIRGRGRDGHGGKGTSGEEEEGEDEEEGEEEQGGLGGAPEGWHVGRKRRRE